MHLMLQFAVTIVVTSSLLLLFINSGKLCFMRGKIFSVGWMASMPNPCDDDRMPVQILDSSPQDELSRFLLSMIGLLKVLDRWIFYVLHIVTDSSWFPPWVLHSCPGILEEPKGTYMRAHIYVLLEALRALDEIYGKAFSGMSSIAENEMACFIAPFCVLHLSTCL